MKILIIDDEPLIGLSFQRIYENLGHTVLIAHDSIEGETHWTRQWPELVLLDILMPGRSGPQLLEELTTKHGRSALGRVVLMSAHTGNYSLDSAKLAGADEFIAKPFSNIIELAHQLLLKMPHN